MIWYVDNLGNLVCISVVILDMIVVEKLVLVGISNELFGLLIVLIRLLLWGESLMMLVFGVEMEI